MIKRFNQEEFLNRVNYLWEQFHSRPEMLNVSYEDFKKECFEEYYKQQQMSDEALDIYRKKIYNNILKEADKLTTPQEKEKLNQQDKQTITIQDEMKFKKGEDMVNGDSKKV